MATYVEATGRKADPYKPTHQASENDGTTASFTDVMYEQYSKALEAKRSLEQNPELKRVNYDFKGAATAQDRNSESYWEKRIKRHKENMELSEKEMLKRKLLEAQLMRRRLMYDSDGQPTGYISGISAAEILSGII